MPWLAGCNTKVDNTDPYYVLSTNVGVTDFTLKADTKVMAKLDSVFFSIDLERCVIFNADSLPKGTDITGLIPVITYPESVSKAEIVQTGGKRDGTIDYIKNPSDSVDFTGNVTLNLTAQDGTTTRSYKLKVNVHQEVPDSIIWNQVAISTLPSRNPSPRVQKTVMFKGAPACLLEEADGSFTLSTNTDIFNKTWEKKALNLPFTPNVRTFTGSSTSLFMLSESGELFTSADGVQWSSTGKAWLNIIGDYQGRLLGLRMADGKLTHTEYPEGVEAPAEAGFPVEGYSNFVISSNKWTQTPSSMISGGRLADGTLSDATWGFDGSVWAHIDNGRMPALLAPTLIPYYAFRKTTTSWILNQEYNVWLCIGGRLADGAFNSDTYISFDNGVHWKKTEELMTLPDFLPKMAYSDGLVFSAPYSASLSADWTKTRISYEIDGLEIKWDCPYIFLFGGIDATERLCDTIWRGVLARLTFTPVI